MGLPDRDHYFKDDAKSQQLRDAYVKHIAAIAAPSNMPAFQQAFGCQAGDPMVREERCVI
jgi:predicted metalloendopeptidase